MRSVSAPMQAHLDGRATTLCHCWRVTRLDGVVQGFTDHDRDLTLLSTTFEAASGFTATQVQQTSGLAVDNMDVEGAIKSDALTDDDISAGKYDGASVEVYKVNWANVSQFVLLQRGTLGEVKRDGASFVAELRSLAQALNQKVGRQYQRYCDTKLGSPRCTVDLADPAYLGEGTVGSVTGRLLGVSGLADFDDDWFSRGVITWLTGSNAGLRMHVKKHTNENATMSLELWETPTVDVEVGDTFEVTAGCDKSVDMCRLKFSNLPNFQGFNLMPGNDAVTAYPTIGDGSQDGGSLFR